MPDRPARLIDHEGRVTACDVELEADGKPPKEMRVPHCSLVQDGLHLRLRTLAVLVFQHEGSTPAFERYRWVRSEAP